MALRYDNVLYDNCISKGDEQKKKLKRKKRKKYRLLVCPLDSCSGEQVEITGVSVVVTFIYFVLHFSNECTNFLVLNICIFAFND